MTVGLRNHLSTTDITYRTKFILFLRLFAAAVPFMPSAVLGNERDGTIGTAAADDLEVVVRAVDPDGRIHLSDAGELVLAGLDQSHLLTRPNTRFLGFLRKQASAMPSWTVWAPLSDRYGRVSGQVRLPNGAWLQQALLQQGLARYSGEGLRPRNRDALLAAEDRARRSGDGLWGGGAWRVYDASVPSAVPYGFQIVEGVVTRVARVGTRTFVNFGDDWRNDFTLGAAGGSVKARDGTVLRLSGLVGRQVRVRGMVRQYNGPYMDLVSQEQIVFLD